MEKQCISCGLLKPADQYTNPQGTKRNQKCKECRRAVARIRERKRPKRQYDVEQKERNRLRCRYNTAVRHGVKFRDRKHFWSLVEQEKKGCEICGSFNRLCIDHDHETGRPRGILCQGCNQAIGCFNESPWKMQKAIAYLRREGD